MEFFATCPKGFEELLAGELAGLGLKQVRKLKGQVSFEGDLEDGYRSCLWSRIASRIVMVMERVQAQDSDTLYASVSQIPWEEHIKPGTTIAIDARGTNANLRNTQFSAMRTKDAIADRLQSKVSWRPQVDTANPQLKIVVRIHQDRATIGMDMSGEPLFKRGWELSRNRVKNLVPLRADYAAALLAACGWYRLCRKDNPALIVPFAGAGTLLVEAASQVQNIAPGLIRQNWGFFGWAQHDMEIWDGLMAEAHQLREEGQKRTACLIASDTRKNCQLYCNQALRAAGVSLSAHFVSDPLQAEAFKESLKLLKGTTDHPCVPIHLAWVDEDDLPVEAKALASVAALRKNLRPGAHVAAFAADSLLSDVLHQDPETSSSILMGNQDAFLTTCTIQEADRDGVERSTLVTLRTGETISCLMPTSDQFASRLEKVCKLRRKWAQREWISCYRIYDQDLPDYAVSIDLFQGIDGKGRWLYISEYAAPKEIDALTAKKRLMDILALAPAILDVKPENTFLKVRTRSKGGSQYAQADKGRKPAARNSRGREGEAGRPGKMVEGAFLVRGAHLVDEGGLTFEVNFQEKLDCGLFLDHRDTREMLREMMKETQGSKRFLNLFAYTGSATCYAADGGAKYTTTVDLSNTYLKWAQRNMARNGFTCEQHEFIQADVLQWVHEQRHTKNRWDLIFCDPPTFSNSSSMRSRSFEIQRDHAEMLIDISRLLIRGGICVFSCNLRNFKPDTELLEKAGVHLEDITDKTIPEDFQRNRKVHHTYLLTRFR